MEWEFAMQFDFSTIISFILIFGFFGGLSSYFAFCLYGADGGFRNEFHINFSTAALFTMMNGVIGVAGAFAIQVLLLAMRFYDKPDPKFYDFIYLSAICIVGGFAARSFLSQVSQMFAQQIKRDLEELAKKTNDRSDEQARQIVMLESMNDSSTPESLRFVIKTADAALKKNPEDGALVIAKGSALKRLNRLQEAIETLMPYIARHPSPRTADRYNVSTAVYNRACYNALLGRTEPALNDLKRSLELSEDVAGDRQYAAKDPDFAGIKDDPRFKELIND
jgi:tetratricopeptide (TPR) repeat protein